MNSFLLQSRREDINERPYLHHFNILRCKKASVFNQEFVYVSHGFFFLRKAIAFPGDVRETANRLEII